MGRDLNEARRAYGLNDVELARAAHGAGVETNENHALNGPLTPHVELHSHGGDYIKSMVYGGLDGIVTTYAVVTSVLGINLTPGVVLTLGLATLFADAIAMGLGDYLSSKSENDFYKQERMREEWEVENNPDGERLEMVEIYKSKGVEHDDAIIITETMSQNKRVWVDVMMIEELGLLPADDQPFKNALVTFISFIIFGIVPILPFIVGAIAGMSNGLFVASTVLTAAILFVLGFTKALFTKTKWYWSGLETLILGSFAAAVAYAIGLAFAGLKE